MSDRYPSFSVLMSIYAKEKPEYARQSFDSLLSQTIQANEWVIVEDGPLTPELYALLEEYENKNPGLIKRIPIKVNGGLGPALAKGIQCCSNELVARMDTDDISRKDRFEKQLKTFIKYPKLDICGSWITEFEGTPENIVAKRQVPLKEAQIRKYQKKRDAFNHVTVMYRKSSVISAGNYQNAPLMEDTMLWANMLSKHARCMNIGEYLVNVRIGKDMYDRRGGWGYYKKYRDGRRMVLSTGYISYFDYLETIAVQFVVALMPSSMRSVIFKRLLHKK